MESAHRHLEVAVALPVHGTFTYRLPAGYSPDGVAARRVLVPFGKRRVTGYVLGAARDDGALEAEGREIKEIADVLDDGPLFPPSMVPFFRWISDYYHHPVGEVIRTALPGGLNCYERQVLSIDEAGGPEGRRDPSGLRREVLACLRQGDCTAPELGKRLGRPVPETLIRSMEACGWIRRRREMRGGRTRPKTALFVQVLLSPADDRRPTPARRRLWDILADTPEAAVADLVRVVPSARSVLRRMERDGLVRLASRAVYRDPFGETVHPDSPPELTGEQAAAVDAIRSGLERGFTRFLLTGVTGGGKTEIYLRAAAIALERGLNALVLVPEIALISQTERRFRARFGDRIALLHSGLSAGERLDQWRRIRSGDARIVVGARSAVFAPFDRVGLVVVDEEHDPSYKQDSGLRYNGRDLAVLRAQLSQCPVVLGTATPSVQSLFQAESGRYIRLSIRRRIADRRLPEIEIVDLRETRDLRGTAKYLTPVLLEAVSETLARQEQALLFLNRRGFASYPVCSSCGQAMRCRHCDITLTLHQNANAYRCHYCGHTRPGSSPCPACGSTAIWPMGLGTEKLEEAMGKHFPEARIARMDRDTTAAKGRLVGILKALKRREIDILVGTQMVAKGHDFRHVTLVGIVCADLSLSFPDFRAGERTFQLLAQVAGRAGRGDRPGRVVLQTFNPEHFSIQAAKAQDPDAFYREEIRHREALGYPPFSRMVQFRITAKDPRKAAAAAEELGERCRRLLAGSPGSPSAVRVLGPLEAPLARIAGHHRWQLLLIGRRPGLLHRIVGQLAAPHQAGSDPRGARIAVDVDPFFMM
jgi:primosomal protein N' (replication factor Y)